VIDCSFADEDVVKVYLAVRHCLKGTSKVRESAVTKISDKDAAKLEELRLKSSFLQSHVTAICSVPVRRNTGA
jgi:hypothetical protein